MARNFNISIHRNSDSLHLKLKGDFDGSSACELINVLETNSYKTSKVFIHTSCLNKIHPFGRQVFCNNFNVVNGESPKFVFTGEKASQIEP
jgi:hypothetical protein